MVGIPFLHFLFCFKLIVFFFFFCNSVFYFMAVAKVLSLISSFYFLPIVTKLVCTACYGLWPTLLLEKRLLAFWYFTSLTAFHTYDETIYYILVIIRNEAKNMGVFLTALSKPYGTVQILSFWEASVCHVPSCSFLREIMIKNVQSFVR